MSNEFIELTNGAGRVKAELPYEFTVPYALDEGRHIYLCEEAWDLLSLLWFVRPLVDANELGGSDSSLPLVAEPGFKQVDELSEAGYGVRGKRGEPHFSLLVQGGRESSALEPFRSGMKVHVDIIVDHMSLWV
ncbi:hypothetical protein ACLOJK_015053 [Asimina triloba]